MTIMLVSVKNGKKRVCDDKCYNATGKRCTCICGGANHGKGEEQAFENTEKLYEADDGSEDGQMFYNHQMNFFGELFDYQEGNVL